MSTKKKAWFLWIFSIIKIVHFTFEIFLKNFCCSDFHGLPIRQKIFQCNVISTKLRHIWYENGSTTVKIVFFSLKYKTYDSIRAFRCSVFRSRTFLRSAFMLPFQLVSFSFSNSVTGPFIFGQAFSPQTSFSSRSVFAHFIGQLTFPVIIGSIEPYLYTLLYVWYYTKIGTMCYG